MTILILGLIFFLGIHSVRMFVPGLREVFLSSWGDNAWKGIYSGFSLVGFVLIIWGYGAARETTGQLYLPPVIGAQIAAFLMIPSFILLIASQLPAGRIKVAVRHPMVLGVIIWAAAHLLSNGDTASVILFGSFLAWAVVNRMLVTKRGLPNFGKVALRYDAISTVVGFAVYLVFVIWLHSYLIGVSPLGG